MAGGGCCHRADQRADGPRQGGRPEVARPRARLLEERGERLDDVLGLLDRRGQHDECQGEHGQEEDGIDRQDGRAAAKAQAVAQGADDRLEGGRQQDGDEQQEQHARRSRTQGDQAKDDQDAGRQAHPADGPRRDIGAHRDGSQCCWRVCHEHGHPADPAPWHRLPPALQPRVKRAAAPSVRGILGWWRLFGRGWTVTGTPVLVLVLVLVSPLALVLLDLLGRVVAGERTVRRADRPTMRLPRSRRSAN